MGEEHEKGRIRENPLLEKYSEQGARSLGRFQREHRFLFSVEPKRLWRGLGDGRDDRSIVHTGHVTLVRQKIILQTTAAISKIVHSRRCA